MEKAGGNSLVRKLWLALFVMVMMASPCYGALIHHYQFDSDVSDSVGSETGTLLDGAYVADGVLNLDGTDDYVQFSSHIVPTTGSYTVALFGKQNAVQTGIWVEMISQGVSGGPGFYIGHDPNGIIRASDSWSNTGISFPSDGQFHHYALVVDSVAGSSTLYVDGSLRAAVGFAIATTSVGDHTRLGHQFDPYAEFFNGALDDVRIYDNALSGAEIASLAAVPEPATMLLLSTGLIGLAGARRKMKK